MLSKTKLKQVARLLGYKLFFTCSWKEFDREDLLKIIKKQIKIVQVL